MSQIAEPVIAGLEVVEHFGEACEVLARLCHLCDLERARSVRRLAAFALARDCVSALSAPVSCDLGEWLRLRQALLVLVGELACVDHSGPVHPWKLRDAVCEASDALRFVVPVSAAGAL